MTAPQKTLELPDGLAGQSLGAAPGSASFKKLFADVARRQCERIRKAGKHECVKTPAGTASRVTGRGDKILKRPVAIMRFYECKICGRDMTPNDPS